ncbi:hypothetical protein EMMF5_001515 [Cystobasidiomycetes sp. EMM_F5]
MATRLQTVLQRTVCRQSRIAPSCIGQLRRATTTTPAGTSKPEIPAREQPATSPDRSSHPLQSSSTPGKDAQQATSQQNLASAEDEDTASMSEQEKEILAKLKQAFPGGNMAVQDVSGGCGTFFAISIESDAFKGLSKIKQHQKVNKILADEVKTWHGMQTTHLMNGPAVSASGLCQETDPSNLWLPVRLGVATGILGFVYVVDREYNAEALTRTLRCAYYACLILADFKWNFGPKKTQDEINALHERVAKRMHYVCTKNGGLFIKLGQSIGIQATVMPKPYREAFSTMFDAAPHVSYDEVEKVFREEFSGQSPHDVFEFFDDKPIASASIAQVHRARLRIPKEGGQPGETELREVAVKVQKPAIAKQLNLDLWSYQVMLYVYELAFKIPVYFTAPYVAQQIRLEANFLNEAKNSERTAASLAKEPSLSNIVYVPKVHWQATTPRIMTADFVENAFKINDRSRIEDMGFSVKQVMDAMCGAFSAMIFTWGHVHCDPHPGNILVRRHPEHPKRPQVVLIDHGLYVDLTPSFRRQYSELWRSLFVLDTDTIERIAHSWGIANANLFASATLLKPTTVKKDKVTKEERARRLEEEKAKSAHQVQEELKERLRTMLENEQLIPRELIFITRCMRMVQAVNQGLGSPSNRINILAHWATEGLKRTNPLDPSSGIDQFTRDTLLYTNRTPFSLWLAEKRKIWTFKIVLVFIDFGFLLTKVRQVWIRLVQGKEEGFEDLLQQQVSRMARDEFGVEIDDSAFAG